MLILLALAGSTRKNSYHWSNFILMLSPLNSLINSDHYRLLCPSETLMQDAYLRVDVGWLTKFLTGLATNSKLV